MMNTRQVSTMILLASIGCLFWSACTPKTQEKADIDPRKIEVLFLGHNSEHHNSEALLPVLASTLARHGINFTYTTSLEDINRNNLSHFDALMVYANHDSIGPKQAKALLNYVAEGHGFLPIHSASWCFRNSDKVVELMGGQFLSHGTGVFKADIKADAADHPILKDFTPFETWDETYVHSHHNPDRTVLMERSEGDKKEPWTWVREHGKGRVFYTASGHDERTWENPQFQTLLKNAIVWAAGDRVKSLWEKLPELPDPLYTEAVIPNYEKRDPPPKLQEPLSAEASQLLSQVPPGFELSLFAQEPDIINPISMDWDEKGRLWVLETVDYPNTVRDDDGVGDDRLKILEDTDMDGVADKVTVFAENLNIPTSFVFADGGVIVSQAPHFLFLKDTDGDDVADVREILMTGWGVFDTHAGPSNLQYGIDNHIWGAVGYSGFKGTIDGKEWQFGQGFYRFQPDGSDFDYITRTSNNTWGLGFTEDFHVFGSTANNTHSVHVAIPDRYYEDVKGLPGFGSQKIDGHYAFHPITHNVRQVDVFNGFTAAAGHHVYTARQFPERYWNSVAFVCAPTGRLVHEAILESKGSAFTEKDGWNLMASNDEWFGPVEAKVGPDGSVWIADWYNFIIQHNPTPKGFENGKGNAHINPLRDRQHGRIYRLTYKDGPSYEPIQLSSEQPEELLTALSHDNLFWRKHAQRLLVERGETDVVDDLVTLVSRAKADQIGLKPQTLHALWALDGLGAFESTDSKAYQAVVKTLSNKTPSIRRAAVQILSKSSEGRQAIWDKDLINDNDAHVQLEALLAISKMNANDEIGEALYQLSKSSEVTKDRWLSQAVYIGAARHQDGFIAAWKADPNGEDLSNKEEEYDWVNDPTYPEWEVGQLPAWFHENGHDYYDGAVWFKKEVDLPSGMAGQRGTFTMGIADDLDSVYVNGQLIGTSNRNTPGDRRYVIPSGLLQEGKNVITLQIIDTGGWGGLRGSDESLALQVRGQSYPLAGDWYMTRGKEILSVSSDIFTEDRTILRMFADNYMSDEVITVADVEKPDIMLDLGVIVNEMKYDKTELTVPAGALVEIRFQNKDFMQHNLLIIEKGSLDIVGAAADQLATASDGAAKQYIPSIPEVLHSTKLVDPNTEVKLRFRAPEEPGDYPYVCTFPGHWRIMNGVLTVTKANES